jgi:predicted nucleic acid-binding protein
MILYLDTSALVKRYVAELRSKEVISLIEQANAVGSTILTRVEMASALSKAVRMSWVESDKAEIAWQDFISHWQSFTRLPMTSTLVERAAQLAREYGLRGYAATHFASALMWQELLDNPITLATFDRELWLVAKKVGMAVWPEGI